MKSIKLLFAITLLFSALSAWAFFGDSPKLDFDDCQKTVYLNDNGLNFKIETKANKISDLLNEKGVKLSDHDQVIPNSDSAIYPGINIQIKRAVRMKVAFDGKTAEIYTLENTIAKALAENNIKMGRLDKTSPDLNSLPQNNLSITVTRINIEEVTVQEDIDFKTASKNDSEMGWREKKITTPGEKGTREVKYKITYKDSKEVSRVVLSKNIIKEPVTQVETQGTYVKCGKASKGQGTWYSYQGGMYAASTTIPRGGYARVTNTANGKSIIVQINDYGPQGRGRVIDLDKPAFLKLAPLGAGVIGVKVEEVLN